MLRGSVALTALAVLIPVVGTVGLVDSIADGASPHHAASSSHPSTAKLQKEITALKKALPKTYLKTTNAKKTYLSSAGASSTYLSKTGAASTYLTPSAAATSLVNGNGFVQQGVATIANNAISGVNELLLTSRDGLKFSVQTDPAASDTLELAVQNNSGVDQHIAYGTSDSVLLAFGGPTSSFPLETGAAGKGELTFTIATASAPLQIDTVTIGEYVNSGADQIWAQLVHTGS